MRKLGLSSRRTLDHNFAGKALRRCSTSGSSNWRRKRLFFGVRSARGVGSLPARRFNSASVAASTLTHSRAIWTRVAAILRLKVFSRPSTIFRRCRAILSKFFTDTRSASAVMAAGSMPLSSKAVTAAWI